VPGIPSLSQCVRRDFIVGAAAGFAVTQTAGRALGDTNRFPAHANPSYAQSGEDVIVRAIFEDLGVGRPSYLDVGAYLPIAYNNTYLFYTRGSRGVLVEPNLDLIPRLRADRPGDTTLNLGIGLTDRADADYFCLTLPEWNTFDRGEAERAVKETGGKVKVEKVVKMPLVPINRIIARWFRGQAPDFLSIDVESLDLAILKTLDFERFRPRVVCAETLISHTTRMAPGTTEFLNRQGYEARAVTIANTVYVDARTRPA